MLSNKSLKVPADDRQDAPEADDHWLVADLEARQRGNVYAAGRGDGPGRNVRLWSFGRGRRAERRS